MSKRKLFSIILFIIFIIIVLSIIISLICSVDINKLKEIEKGNYSYIDNETIQEQLPKIFSVNASNMKWIYKDINSDGKKDLILLDSYGVLKIVGIFVIKGQSVATILWDDMDAGCYYQLCDDGLLHYDQYYGIYEYEKYELYHYDENWNEIFVEGLELYYLFESEEGQEQKKYLNEELHMEEAGLYFWKVEKQGEERRYTKLTQEEWTEKFYDLFGRECEGEIFKYFL